MVRKEAKMRKTIERYEKVIEDHKLYYREYRANLSRENFKKFLSFQNKQALGFQIMTNQMKKDYENRFKQTFDQRLAIEAELAAFEKSSNRISNAAFEDIRATVNSILEKANFNYNTLNVPQNDLFKIFKKLEHIEGGLQEFDRKFTEVKSYLQARLLDTTMHESCELIVIKKELLDFDLNLIHGHDPLVILKHLIEKVVDFKARLVISLDIPGLVVPHDRRKELLRPHTFNQGTLFRRKWCRPPKSRR
jgi:hypothetical protein